MVRVEAGNSVSRLHSLHHQAFLVVTVCFLLVTALGVSVTDQMQIGILVVLVILLGLPHGALDPLVARAAGLWQTAGELVVFLCLYLGLVASTILIWPIASGPALTGFLAISAWHFSGDWKRHLPLVARLSAGTAVVAMPALTHSNDVAWLFSMLASPTWASRLQESLAVIALPAILLCAASALTAKKLPKQAIVEVAMIIVLAILLPPLMYFVAYFCFLHSPRHLIEATALIKPMPIGWVVTITMAITLLTIIGASLFLFFLPSSSPSVSMIQIIFIGLAALTVPHMLLIERIDH